MIDNLDGDWKESKFKLLAKGNCFNLRHEAYPRGFLGEYIRLGREKRII
jgi:hypothetical protein